MLDGAGKGAACALRLPLVGGSQVEPRAGAHAASALQQLSVPCASVSLRLGQGSHMGAILPGILSLSSSSFCAQMLPVLTHYPCAYGPFAANNLMGGDRQTDLKWFWTVSCGGGDSDGERYTVLGWPSGKSLLEEAAPVQSPQGSNPFSL